MDLDHLNAPHHRMAFDRPPVSNHSYRGNVDDDSVSLLEILTKFWVRKWFILSFIIICSGLAFGIAKLITPTYTGDAFVMIKPEQSSELVGDATSAVPLQTSPEVVQGEAFVLQSRALASETIERLHLDRDPEFNPSLRKPSRLLSLFEPVLAVLEKVQSRLRPVMGFLSDAADAPATGDAIGVTVEAGKPGAAGKPSTRVVNEFMKLLDVTMQQKSNVIQVSYRSSSPITAASVPNTLIQLYLDQRVGEKDKALTQERERIDNVVLPALRQKLRTSELALADYQQKTGLVSDQNPTVLAGELTDTKAQLAVARAHTAEAAVRLSEVQVLVSSPGQPASASGIASPAVASDSPTLQHLREEEVGLQGQLGALRGSLGPKHPKILQLEAQLKELRGGIRHEGAGFVGRLRAELAAAQATEAALNRKVAEFTHQFAQVNGGDTQLQALIGEVEADRKAYEKYLARLNEVHSSIGHGQPDANLVSRADVPLNRSSPKIKMMVMVGAVIGAGAGIILVAMLDGLRGGLRSKEQVEEALGVRCLGLVPKLERSHRNRLQVPELTREIEGSTLIQPQNAAYGHAIRSARLKLLSSYGDDREPHATESQVAQAARIVLAPTSTGDRVRRTGSRVVLVTAALPGEGKTWVAAGLARSLATDGFSVALVDCDLHRPAVHRMFDGPRGPGLTEYFAGDTVLDEIIHEDHSSGVSYIPVGAALPKSAWRLTSDRVRPLVAQLGEKYAFIILDSAPVLAVSETILLSQIAQKTVLVVKWGARLRRSLAMR